MNEQTPEKISVEMLEKLMGSASTAGITPVTGMELKQKAQLLIDQLESAKAELESYTSDNVLPERWKNVVRSLEHLKRSIRHLKKSIKT